MSEVGRNDPCPCGSGKKHKKCCLAKGAATALAGAYTTSERQSALDMLFRFGRRAEFEEARSVATAAFWGDWAGRHTDVELREAMALERSDAASLEWFVFDFRLRSGRTVVEELLRRERGAMRTGEVRYLERMRLSHIRPYEVARVRPEEGLDLRDLWTGKGLSVQERLATRQLVQWDVLGARVVLGPAGLPVIDGLPYLYPAMGKAAILKRLRQAHRGFRRPVPRGDLVLFFKMNTMLFHHLWLDHVALRPLPRMLTAEGDEFVFARVLFDVKDRAAVAAALAGHPDLHPQGDGSYVWLEAMEANPEHPAGSEARSVRLISMRIGEGVERRRTLGVVVPEGKRLVVEANSRPRAERARAMIEALAGGAVAYRATSYEGVGQALERHRGRRAEPSGVPPEVEAALAQDFYAEHYGTWLDQPLPALGGRTPRQAAALKSERPGLISLLKAMENMAERDRREGRPAYDFGWMWAELGLDRPG